MPRNWKKMYQSLEEQYKEALGAYCDTWERYRKILEDRTRLLDRVSDLQGEITETRAAEALRIRRGGETLH